MTENERDTQHNRYDQSPVNDGNMTMSRKYGSQARRVSAEIK